MPSGVGEPFFDSVESEISHAMFSIPGVKGVLFGLGEGFISSKGSEVNDEFYLKNSKISTKTNNNGGINGGITNGENIVFSVIVKPTPSIFKEQNTVNLKTMQEEKLLIEGRHDPSIIHRARVVADSLTALVLVDLLSQKYGTEYFSMG